MNDEKLKQELKEILQRVVLEAPEPPLNKEYVVTISADTIMESQVEEIMNLLLALKLSHSITLVDSFIIFCSQNDLSFDRNLANKTKFAERPYISLIKMGALFKKDIVEGAIQ